VNILVSDKSTVHYKGRQRSILGKVSLGVGLSALFFLVFLILYARSHELPGIGGLGIINGLLAIAGAVCSATARRETPFLDGYALSGLILNLGIVVVTFALVLIGAAV